MLRERWAALDLTGEGRSRLGLGSVWSKERGLAEGAGGFVVDREREGFSGSADEGTVAALAGKYGRTARRPRTKQRGYNQEPADQVPQSH